MLRTLTVLATLIGFVILSAATVRTSGVPSSVSGSTGDNQSCTSCHTSGTNIGNSINITSNIPTAGYSPNTTYAITITATGSVAKAGFQATFERMLDNSKQGTLTATNTTETIVNGTNWINHKSPIVAGSAGSKSWSFNWRSPVAGLGTIRTFAVVNFSNNDGGSGGDVIVTSNKSFTENTALPITLLSFISKVSEKGVLLSWQTATELNNQYFEIERLTETQTWQTLTRIAGAGNSSLLRSYVYTDDQAPLGTTYYRLKQVDFNGAYTYSKVVTALVSTLHALTVYPTIGEVVSVNLPLELQQATLELYTGDGKLVNTIAANGRSIVPISKETFGTGIYHLRIAGNTAITPQKVILF